MSQRTGAGSEQAWSAGSRPGRALYGRRLMPAGRVLVVILVMLLTWTVMYAPALKRAADASPIGVRRTVSLAVLTPIAAVSEFFRLDALAETIERAVGRDPRAGGAFVPPPDDLPVVPPDADPNDGEEGPSPEYEPIREPTPTRRLRVVVIGDSLAAGLGYFAERVFRPKLVRVSRQGRISTGLARPDYFNWPVAMRRIVNAFDPDLVIVMLGENDRQSLQTVGGGPIAQLGTTEWPAEYRSRVLQMMRIATSRGAKVVWAGLPISADERFRAHAERQNDIYEFAAEISTNVAYFDAWERFQAPRGGGYTAYFRESGRVVLIRAGDGLHFTSIGYTILAREIAETAAETFGLVPRTFETEL
jgi:lysophospholipase L1-like esterase